MLVVAQVTINLDVVSGENGTDSGVVYCVTEDACSDMVIRTNSELTQVCCVDDKATTLLIA